MAYIGVSPSNGVRRVHTYTATASQTTFSGAGAEGTSLSYKDSNFVDVYQNGIKLGDADYTSTSGTSIVLAQGASVSDLVVVVVFDVFSVADTVSKADGGTFDGNITMAGTLGVTGATTLSSNLSVDGGTIKLDGNYPTGNFNVAIGDTALDSITDGSGNVAIGHATATALTSGTLNTAVGYIAFDANTTGSTNTAIGASALSTETQGSKSTAVGYGTLATQNFTSATDSYNTGIGYNAGAAVTTGQNNTFLGSLSSDALTVGNNNTALGMLTLSTDTQGSQNVAVGYGTLGSQNFTSATNSGNTGVGYQAGAGVTTGLFNTLIGGNAGDALTDADFNVSVGNLALGADTKGNKSVAIGVGSLQSQNFTSSTDSFNTAVGYNSGASVTTGTSNTLIGSNAGSAITIGGSNVFVGKDAGDTTTQASRNICIGQNANNFSATDDDAIVIGHDITGSANDFTFGKASNRVINDFDTDAAFTRSSDVRLKKNIQNSTLGLDFINDLRTVKYNWKPSDELDATDAELTHLRKKDKDGNVINNMNTTTTMHGFVAQEVKTALDTAGVDDFKGWSKDEYEIQQVSREMFTIPLVKAVQELSAQVTALQAEVKALKGE